MLAPGNAGTAVESGCRNLDVKVTYIVGVVAAAREHEVRLVVVGPEDPLVDGLVDACEAAGVRLRRALDAAAGRRPVTAAELHRGLRRCGGSFSDVTRRDADALLAALAPTGALTADEIAETALFFSFGTNDLTQTALGLSRDDSGSFLPNYQEDEIVINNPFAVVDQTGVGQLMEIAATKGRSTRKNIKLGICGEHGGEPSSVKFCHSLGLNYVSCSPFRVPVARLAAAQAALG